MDRKYEFKLCGAFNIISPAGEYCLPAGRKEQALLAVLALSPRFRRTRKWIQALLWGDRAPQQAAASLRQSLYSLRRHFCGKNLLFESDGESVWLVEQAFKTDLDNDSRNQLFGDQELLLNGIDLKEEAFEDWLRLVRSEFASPKVAPYPLNENLSKSDRSAKPTVYVVLNSEFTDVSVQVTTMILYQSLLQTMSEFGSVSVVEASTVSAISHRALPGNANDLILLVTPLLDVDDLVLSTAVLNFSDRHTLRRFVHSLPIVGGSGSISNYIMEACAAIINLIDLRSSFESEALAVRSHSSAVWNGLMSIGSLSVASMKDHAERAVDLEPSAINRSLRAAVGLLYYGERVQETGSEFRNQILEDLRSSFAREPSNGLVSAFAGHGFGFYKRDFSTGIDLTKEGTKLSPHNAMCWALYACSLIYAGRHREAEIAATRAHRIGSKTISRPLLEAISCMASALNGNYTAAIRAGEMALTLNPTFRPTLTYLTCAYARTRQFEKAETLGDRLIEVDPGFSISLLKSPDYPIPGTGAQEFLAESLKELGRIPK